MKRVIINADDFGLSPSVNEGIILAHRQGILTSATLMANTPGFEEAVALAKENPRLGVGLHLNIVRGVPVSSPQAIPSLVTPEGLFPSRASVVMRKLFLGGMEKDEFERELRAQVEKALAAGVRLSHFDSEKNLHALPPFFKLVLKLGQDYGIRKVRFVREYRLSPPIGQSVKGAFLSLAGGRMRKRLRRAGMMITDRFYGISYSGRMTAAALDRILSRQKNGSAEIMVHPGFVRQDLLDLEPTVGSYFINKFREAELEALLDAGLKETVRRCGIQLINFHEL